MLDKIQISVKELKNATRHVSCEYSDLQNLLRFCCPVAYVHSRTWGWRCDVYELPYGITLSTGYQTYGTQLPHEFVKEYETKAKEARKLKVEEERVETKHLLNSFCRLIESQKLWKK